jgi:protein subunit release factor A
LKQVQQGLADARAMLAESDADLRAMAEEEIASLARARQPLKKS